MYVPYVCLIVCLTRSYLGKVLGFYKIIKSKRSRDGAQQHLQRSVQPVMPAGVNM